MVDGSPNAKLLHGMPLPFVVGAHPVFIGGDDTVSAEVRLPRAVGWLLRLCPFLRPSIIRINLDGLAVSERAQQEYLQ